MMLNSQELIASQPRDIFKFHCNHRINTESRLKIVIDSWDFSIVEENLFYIFKNQVEFF